LRYGFGTLAECAEKFHLSLEAVWSTYNVEAPGSGDAGSNGYP